MFWRFLQMDNIKNEDTSKWFDIPECAEFLRISERTVRRRIDTGKIKAETVSTKHGDKYIINPSQFNAVTDVIKIAKVKREFQKNELAMVIQTIVTEQGEAINKKLEVLENNQTSDNVRIEKIEQLLAFFKAELEKIETIEKDFQNLIIERNRLKSELLEANNQINNKKSSIWANLKRIFK